MRPTSVYLHEMLRDTPACKLNLSGSSPPFRGPDDFFKDIKIEHDSVKRQENVFALASAVASLQGASAHEIGFSVGSSQVFTQALAAITDPGDTVLIESPTYDPFFRCAEFLQLKVKFFSRTGDFETDFAALKKNRTKAKVLVISNPNCPTGQIYSRESLFRLAGLARHLIVDEVFLPLFAKGRASLVDGGRPTNIISIGTLSKSLGLSALRVGWLRAPQTIGEKFFDVGLNFHIEMPSYSVKAALKAVEHWPQLIAPNLDIADQNRKVVQRWAAENPGRLSHDFSQGYFGTLRVLKPFRSGDEFAADFLKKTGVWVRPTRLFRLPNSVRFHILGPAEEWQRAATSLLL